MARRVGDRYLTPDGATLALLDQAPEIRGASCLDPMSGDGRMMARFAPRFKTLITNDLDPATPAQHHLDAVGGDGMALWLREPAWVITNPAFTHAAEVARLALRHATRGVALLLRCTWLEPCRDREWLAETPPLRILALPRISFTGGGSDSAPAWWMIWQRQRGFSRKRAPGELAPWDSSEALTVITREQLRAYEQEGGR